MPNRCPTHHSSGPARKAAQAAQFKIDLAAFHARYKNDTEGAPAYDPAVLLKIILLAYSRGIVSSRKIEAACRENVLFIAVSGDSQLRPPCAFNHRLRTESP